MCGCGAPTISLPGGNRAAAQPRLNLVCPIRHDIGRCAPPSRRNVNREPERQVDAPSPHPPRRLEAQKARARVPVEALGCGALETSPTSSRGRGQADCRSRASASATPSRSPRTKRPGDTAVQGRFAETKSMHASAARKVLVRAAVRPRAAKAAARPSRWRAGGGDRPSAGDPSARRCSCCRGDGTNVEALLRERAPYETDLCGSSRRASSTSMPGNDVCGRGSRRWREPRRPPRQGARVRRVLRRGRRARRRPPTAARAMVWACTRARGRRGRARTDGALPRERRRRPVRARVADADARGARRLPRHGARAPRARHQREAPRPLVRGRVRQLAGVALHAHQRVVLDWYLLSRARKLSSVVRSSVRCRHATGAGKLGPGYSFYAWIKRAQRAPSVGADHTRAATCDRGTCRPMRHAARPQDRPTCD